MLALVAAGWVQLRVPGREPVHQLLPLREFDIKEVREVDDPLDRRTVPQPQQVLGQRPLIQVGSFEPLRQFGDAAAVLRVVGTVYQGLLHGRHVHPVCIDRYRVVSEELGFGERDEGVGHAVDLPNRYLIRSRSEHRHRHLLRQSVVVESAPVGDVHRVGEVGRDHELVLGVLAGLARCQRNDEVGAALQSVQPLFVHQVVRELLRLVVRHIDRVLNVVNRDDCPVLAG